MGFGSPPSVTRHVVARILGTSPRYMLHIVQLVGSWKNVRPRSKVGHCMIPESAVRPASTASVCHRTGRGLPFVGVLRPLLLALSVVCGCGHLAPSVYTR